MLRASLIRRSKANAIMTHTLLRSSMRLLTGVRVDGTLKQVQQYAGF